MMSNPDRLETQPTAQSTLPQSPVPQSAASQSPPRLSRALNWLQPSPETIVLLLAVVIGGGAGMGVVTFRYVIDITHHLLLEDLMGKISGWGPWTLAAVPTMGGVIVGLMRWRLREFGPGITALISNIQGGQDVSPLRPVTKMLAAAISLGSGASLGPEGPSVEIGANLGALLGQALQMSQERQRLLLGAGAAAGLAAGFNAPIAGVFFALEVALGTTFATSAASVVLLSAVVSSLIAQIGLGTKPAFAVPIYEVRSPLELPLYIGLGFFASFVAIAYMWLNKWSQRAFKGQVPQLVWLAQIPPSVQPALGGLCLGLVSLKLPQVLGIGYETVEALLRDVRFSLPLLGTLLVLKLLLTALSLGSGLVGGVFAPAMFLGATLGAAYGKALPIVLPMFADSIAAPPAYAMVGMAAVLAASARAPLTAILLLFELTRDYRIVLPLMAAVGLSVWLVERLKAPPKEVPIEGSATTRIATIVPIVDEDVVVIDPEQALLKRMTVAEVMQSTVITVECHLLLPDAALSLIEQELHVALVMADDTLIGLVTLQDINRAIARLGHDPLQTPPTVGEICTQQILYAYLDETVAEAQTRMAARGLRQLPVLDRDDTTGAVVGLLDQERIVLISSLTLTRQSLNGYLNDRLVASEQAAAELVAAELMAAELAAAELVAAELAAAELVAAEQDAIELKVSE